MQLFIDRLDFILRGRKKHPWGQSLGISQGVITTMFAGTVPHADVLSAMACIDNVSISWLLEARGAPFIVDNFACPDAVLAAISPAMERHHWSVAILSDGTREVVVLARPASLKTKQGQCIDYSLSKIIASGVNADVVAYLRHHKKVDNIALLNLSIDELSRLKLGYMGNYELLGWRDQPGLLSNLPVVVPLSDYEQSPKITPFVINDKDTITSLYNNIQRLTPAHQRVTHELVKALLKNEEKEWTYGD